jgi:hypothetical protein
LDPGIGGGFYRRVLLRACSRIPVEPRREAGQTLRLPPLLELRLSSPALELALDRAPNHRGERSPRARGGLPRAQLSRRQANEPSLRPSKTPRIARLHDHEAWLQVRQTGPSIGLPRRLDFYARARASWFTRARHDCSRIC